MNMIGMFGWALGTWIGALGVVVSIAHRDLRWTLLIPIGVFIAWIT